MSFIEVSAWKMLWLDGIADICFAIILFVAGLSMIFTQYSNYITFLYILPFIVNITLKKQISFPRIGRKKFRDLKPKKNFLIIFLFIIILTIIFVTVVKFNIFRYSSSPTLIVSTFIFLVFALNAFLFDFHRLYFYAGIVVATYLLSEMVVRTTQNLSSAGSVYITASIIVFIMGLSILSIFTKTHKK